MEWPSNFAEAEEENTRKALSQLKKDFEIYENSLNLLMETIDQIASFSSPKRRYSGAKAAIMSILPRIIQSMQSIRILALKGYYYDVAVLQRSLLESIGLCAYFALNEEEARNWIKGGDVKIAKIELFDYVFLLIGEKGTRGARSVYGELCRYVHANVRAIISLVDDIDRTKGTIAFHFLPEFDKNTCRESISCFPTLMLLVLSEIFENELGDKTRKGIVRIVEEYLTET